MTDNREIREGAGLTEARLNQDFIDFLRKWSTPVLVVVALAAVSYAGYTRWKERKIQTHNNAYAEFERVAGVANPSPESLKRVADENEGVGGVSLMARLTAGDVYLQAVRRGIRPGTAIEPDGSVKNTEDLLNADDRKAYLDQAEQLYQRVAKEARLSDSQRILAISANFGLAAVAECREDFDGARKFYNEVQNLSKDTPFSQYTAIALERLTSIDSLKNPVRIYTKAELPAEAVAPPPVLPIQPGAVQPPPAQPTTPAPGEPAGPPLEPASGPEAPQPEAPKPDAPAPAPGESPK
ncbi:MAG TPA: hypothetical protein VK176_15595 [Phycisphaerales bacterium]|nr:hypothetical protein [Phycisphaerales bacterium]